MTANTSFLDSKWLRPFNDPGLWHALGRTANPLYSDAASGHGIAARVLHIRPEGPNVKTFRLAPNLRFPGQVWQRSVSANQVDASPLGLWQAGQPVSISAQVHGRWLSRSFSVSSALAQAKTRKPWLEITVQENRQAPAKASLSQYLHHAVSIGDILHLSPLQGHLRWKTVSNPTLLLAAGSGITPMMGLLRSMEKSAQNPLILVHSYRGPENALFASELAALSKTRANFHYFPHDSARLGRLDFESLLNSLDANLRLHAASDWNHVEAKICGPNAFAQTAERALEDRKVQHVQTESFGFTRGPWTGVSEPQTAHPLRLNLAKQTFTGMTQTSLLESLEQAGLRPEFGCRRGICKRCQCLKVSGVAENLANGELSEAPNELISLCMHAPRSALELAL